LAGTASQAFAVSLQTPLVHCPSSAEQSRVDPVHSPASQASPTVQNWPSSQVPPWFAACASHASVVSLQAPVVHVESKEEQSGATPG
jgi:hypothetical protein